MGARGVGWVVVGVQILLLGLMVVLPRGSDWPTPAWVELLSWVIVATGIVIAVAAALGLGRSLTPNPVPRASGQLVTDGLYRFVRHPIYTGALLLVVGLALRSGSVATAAAAAATIVFFSAKARVEERHLATRFAGYNEYAAATPRFFPRLSGHAAAGKARRSPRPRRRP
ncbi:MAG: isoprenylcysteine carboxylmethyltransferase family protein [Gaiellales bacterium]